jgi:hypothetical protein
MDVFVTLKYKLRDVCEQPGDFGPDEPFETLEELVRDLIAEEGILGLAEDQAEIVNVQEAKP